MRDLGRVTWSSFVSWTKLTLSRPSALIWSPSLLPSPFRLIWIPEFVEGVYGTLDAALPLAAPVLSLTTMYPIALFVGSGLTIHLIQIFWRITRSSICRLWRQVARPILAAIPLAASMNFASSLAANLPWSPLSAIILVGLGAAPATAQQPAAFAVPQTGISFETGDSWVQGNQRIRLFGVQACLRGTTYVNPAGVRGDCGEASLVYLAALIRDLKPRCAPITQTADPPEIIVVCSAELAGSTLDLGTIMIAQGYAFAAFAADHKPVYMAYLVAELIAKKARSGLWATEGFAHPTQMLMHAIKP
ncbi:Endonuclease YncB, thermonuclease family [Rhizobiales bacterium GAS188]|nr:Endonuclease YncB, thermonuclease family [Rhizobiales bacterium GAS188]